MNEFLDSIIRRDPAAKSHLSVLLTYPGVKAVFLHKFSNKIWKMKLYLLNFGKVEIQLLILIIMRLWLNFLKE